MSRKQFIVILLTGIVLGALGYMVGKYAAEALNEERTLAVVTTEAPTHLPDFILYDMDGSPVNRAAFEGKALFINFWATWCAPCRKEIPLLVEMQEQYGADGLQVIGIAIDNLDATRAFIDDIGGVNYPILLGRQELDAIETAEAMGVEIIGLPISLITDANGKILEIHTGEIHQPEIDRIADMMLGKPQTTEQAATE